jgi:hypothetical protein
MTTTIPAGTFIRTPINVALENASLGSGNITDGSIVNADINASAAIGLSKLATGALPTAITIANANVTSNAAIAGTKVAPAFGAQAVTSTTSIGYATGAGGAVTQETDKSTTVELNKICGAITTDDDELAGAAEVSFTVTNDQVAATDVVMVCVKSGASTGTYIATVSAVAAGSFVITLANVGSTASEALVLNFVVIKAVAA